MKAVTIDRLKLEDHVRWAEDQEHLDVSLVAEAQMVAPHPGIVGISAIYPSRFDLLFDLQKRNATWAMFESPKHFHAFGRRFFSHHLFASTSWEGGSSGEGREEEREEEEERRAQEKLENIRKKMRHLKRLNHQTPSLFEKDKTTLFRLLESIAWINSLLVQITGRKLQYQKG